METQGANDGLSELITQHEQEPESAVASHNLGAALLQAGRAEDALPLLQSAVRQEPLIKYVITLGQCLEALGAIGPALECYRVSVEKRPEDPELWTRYGNLLQVNGQFRDAETAFAEALKVNPIHYTATIALARLLWEIDRQRAITCLDTALQIEDQDLTARCQLLSLHLLFSEWSKRIERGQMPYHATSLDEMLFEHAQPIVEDLKSAASALVQQNPTQSWPRMTDALATFASGDLTKAQTKFQLIDDDALSPMAQAVRFDEEFFTALQHSAAATNPTKGLPKVITAKDGNFAESGILYMACDATYFDNYTKPLLRSLAHCGRGSQVHIHLMDSPETHTDTAIQFCKDLPGVQTALTVEQPNLSKDSHISARCYFHAIRFIRFYEEIKKYDNTLWMMDVDALFNRSPELLFAGLANADIALRVRPGRLEPWNQFNACLVGVRPTAVSLDYLASIATYISYFYDQKNLPWGIDQLAMYACFVDAQRRGKAPRLHLLDDKALDYEYLPEGILWCSSGNKKLAALSRAVEESPTATNYDRAFLRYQDNARSP